MGIADYSKRQLKL